jgi:hypothetical protein
MKIKFNNRFQYRALCFAAISAVDLIFAFINSNPILMYLCLAFLIMAEINEAFNTYINHYKNK